MVTNRSVTLALLLVAGGLTIAAQSPLLTPAPSSEIAVTSPGNIVHADVNEDGRSDLLVASAPRREITLLLGSGDGRFTPRQQGSLSVPDPPHELALGDVNGDSHVDLAVGSHDSYRIAILLGDGSGGFTSAREATTVIRDGGKPHTHGVEIADVNNDGRMDLLTVNSDDLNDVAVGFGDGTGRFARAPQSPFAVGPSPYPMAVGDVNGDGNADAVVSSTGLAGTSDGLTALFGDGRGGFRRSRIPSRRTRTWFVALADVNGDRRTDILATHTEDSALTVLLGDGKGRFTEVEGSPFDIGSNAWAIRVADMNRDSRSDVVAAAANGIRVLVGNGRGRFTPAPGSPFGTGKGTWKVVVADFNGDQKPDAAATNLESHTVSILLGR